MAINRGNMAQIAATSAKFISTAVVVCLKRELKYNPLPARKTASITFFCLTLKAGRARIVRGGGVSRKL